MNDTNACMAAGIFPVSRHIEDVLDDAYEVKPLQYLYGGSSIKVAPSPLYP
jgi:hypothetical protein